MTFLAESNNYDLMSFLFPLIVVFMSLSIPIVAIITEHLQKKARMRLIEKAIEHGANLEDLKIEDSPKGPQLPYRSGMISLAVGIALILSNNFLNITFGGLKFPLLVGGLITSAIGLALLLNDWLNRDRIKDLSQQEHH